VDVTAIEGDRGSTDAVMVRVRGPDPDAPTLGVLGRLGGVGARPGSVGLRSDAEGAIVAVAAASRLAAIRRKGDVLPDDVPDLVATSFVVEVAKPFPRGRATVRGPEEDDGLVEVSGSLERLQRQRTTKDGR